MTGSPRRFKKYQLKHQLLRLASAGLEHFGSLRFGLRLRHLNLFLTRSQCLTYPMHRDARH